MSNNYSTMKICTYDRFVEFLQFVEEPHLNGEPLSDEGHLMRAVLGGQELLTTLLNFSLLRERDVKIRTGRTPFGRQDTSALHCVESCVNNGNYNRARRYSAYESRNATGIARREPRVSPPYHKKIPLTACNRW